MFLLFEMLFYLKYNNIRYMLQKSYLKSFSWLWINAIYYVKTIRRIFNNCILESNFKHQKWQEMKTFIKPSFYEKVAGWFGHKMQNLAI